MKARIRISTQPSRFGRHTVTNCEPEGTERPVNYSLNAATLSYWTLFRASGFDAERPLFHQWTSAKTMATAPITSCMTAATSCSAVGGVVEGVAAGREHHHEPGKREAGNPIGRLFANDR